MNNGKITSAVITKRLMRKTGKEKKEIKQLINELTEEYKSILLEGNSVCVGDMGTIRVSFSSEGVENPEEFKNDMIHNIKLIFTPSIDFLETIKTKNKMVK